MSDPALKILVTGPGGFVGSALLPRLIEEKQFSVHAAVRETPAGIPSAVTIHCGIDLALATDWSPCLKGTECVVHLAARVHVMHDSASDPLTEFRKVNVEGTLALARQAAAAGVKRFIYLSSIKVNGEFTEPGKPFVEDDQPAPLDPYGISKLEAEQGLISLGRETGMTVVIIRPPLVYGPGVNGNFASMVRWVRRGVPLPLGAIQNQRSLLALDNLVDFIALCADYNRSPRAANEVFLISDTEVISSSELLRKVGNAYGIALRLIPIPTKFLGAIAGLLGMRPAADRLFGSLVLDSSKAKELLGWTPVVSMNEQLQKMAKYDSLV